MKKNDNLNIQDSEEKTALPVGVRLKNAREEKGISLETVHENIKVPLDALRAIEEGYSVRTMSPFYYKGFVKLYGQYLGLDVTESVVAEKRDYPGKSLEQEYKQFFVRDLLTNVINTRRIQQVLIIIIGLIILVGLFKGIQFIFNRPAKTEVKKEVKITKVDQKQNSTQVSPPQVRVIAKPKPTPKPEVKPVPVEEKKAEAVTVNQPGTSPAVISENVKPRIVKNVTLVVRAKKDSWLRVKQDGNVVFQSTLEMGAVETWLADENIEISGKNIDQLEFELNGKMIASTSRKERKAKALLFTKDGLEVRM